MCGVHGVSLRSPALKARYASAPFKSNGIPHSPITRWARRRSPSPTFRDFAELTFVARLQFVGNFSNFAGHGARLKFGLKVLVESVTTSYQ